MARRQEEEIMKPAWTISDARFIAGVAASDQLPPPALAEVAFAGRSNVGKSSLMNALLGRKNLVRTGSTPGTTRQLNLFQARATDGAELVLVDLPGYGFAKRGKHEKSRWGPLIENYLSTRVTLRALVLLLDVRRGVEDEERELLEFVRTTEKAAARPSLPTILVATKIDKLSVSARKPRLAQIGKETGERVIGFSAETGEGKDALWAAIRRHLFAASGESVV
jgi:GTP-binding protein